MAPVFTVRVAGLEPAQRAFTIGEDTSLLKGGRSGSTIELYPLDPASTGWGAMNYRKEQMPDYT